VEALWRLRIVCQLAAEIAGGVLLHRGDAVIGRRLGLAAAPSTAAALADTTTPALKTTRRCWIPRAPSDTGNDDRIG
jgi:hypothetical protein